MTLTVMGELSISYIRKTKKKDLMAKLASQPEWVLYGSEKKIFLESGHNIH